VAGLVAAGSEAVAVPDAGEAVAWDDVVTTVHRQMRSLVGPTRDLEDLTQIALERVARGIEGFEGRARLSTFTYRICTRVALNHWRSWKRWVERFEMWGERPHDDATFRDMGALAPERLAENERRRHLHAALEKLSAMKRLTLTLVDLEELSVCRVAEILECGEPTVRSRLAVARRELYLRLKRDPLFASEESR
jgi:RNA polymerase sigma factor (sigma-70 family)